MVHPVLIGGAVAAAGGVVAKALEQTPEHEALLEDTYETVEAAVDDDIEIPADHGVGEDSDDTLTFEDIEGRPDMVIKGFEISSLIIEVETAAAIDDDPAHVIGQLDGFRKRGYRRVLVVPQKAVAEAESLCEEIDGTVMVSTPKDVDELL